MDDFELQQRIKNAVDGAQPDSARLWENVMNESTHARQVRNAKKTGLVLTVLALAVATPVALNLLKSDEGSIITPDPSGSPTPSETTQPPITARASYVDTQINMAFEIPAGWRTTEFEGHRVVGPKGLPLPPQDGDTAALQIAFGDLGPKNSTPGTFAGYPADITEGENSHWIVVDWPASPTCEGCGGPISIWWEASTEALRDEHLDGFNTILDSIQALYAEDGTIAELADGQKKTRRGRINADVEINGAVLLAADFMDRRATMDDHTPVLSSEGREAYASLTLGPDCPNEKRLDPRNCMPSGFEGAPYFTIESSEAADANSYEVVVSITYEYYSESDSSSLNTFSEHLFVGPGTSIDGGQQPFVVRGVVDEA